MEVTTELKLPEDKELNNYLDEYVLYYQHIWRRVYEDMINGFFQREFESISKYTSFIKSHYNILIRTANSIIRDVLNRLKTLLALKKAQLTETQTKVSVFEEDVLKLQNKVNNLKEKASLNQLGKKELEQLRRLKHSLYQKKNALNKKKQKLKKLQEEVDSKRVTLTFGSKKEFSKQFHLEKTSYKDFNDWKISHNFNLNHNILFLGRIDEKNGNQMVQLIPQEDQTFILRLKKDYPWREENELSYIEVKGLKLKYLNKEITHFLLAKTKKEGKRPIAYRFLKRENKGWYLQIMVKIDKKDCLQTFKDGVIAIDYNDSFLAVAELNEDGNLVNHFNISLTHHAQGGKALAELRDVSKQLTNYAYNKGKPLAIEDLDFRKKKASVKKNKNFNKMIHSFDFSRFKECINRSCEKNQVKFILVNPAYSTLIGKAKFKDRMKLTNHSSAAMVIGRRAMGIKDKIR